MDKQKKVMLEKENGVTKVLELDKEKLDNLKTYGEHLCWDCANALNCSKVMDRQKKTIDKYDFIDDGLQSLDENGNVDFFFVEDCNDFVRDKEKKQTNMDELKARRTLKNLYFGTEHTTEANKIMEELIERDKAAGRRR